MDIAIGKKEDFPDDVYIKDNKIVEAQNDYRRTMEKSNIEMIYNFEYDKKRDFIYYRNSGFNHVLAKIAKEKDIVIGFSFNNFKNAENKYTILGRLQQNYKIAKKYKLQIHVASFAKTKEELQDEFTLKAFERLLNKNKLY